MGHENLAPVLGPAGLDFGFAKLVVLTNAPIENATFQAFWGGFRAATHAAQAKLRRRSRQGAKR